MTDSIANLLAGRTADIPPEMAIIKQFIKDNYQADCGLSLHDSQIVISVQSAALAGALRPRLHELKQLCQTNKRLVIRIT